MAETPMTVRSKTTIIPVIMSIRAGFFISSLYGAEMMTILIIAGTLGGWVSTGILNSALLADLFPDPSMASMTKYSIPVWPSGIVMVVLTVYSGVDEAA